VPDLTFLQDTTLVVEEALLGLVLGLAVSLTWRAISRRVNGFLDRASDRTLDADPRDSDRLFFLRMGAEHVSVGLALFVVLYGALVLGVL